MAARKNQRVRDPIHDLVVFRAEEDLDQLAWRLLNTREFQRLRRIRQLGFSEFVFPGATHTRFAHCIGVFHVARRLLEVIKRKTRNYDRNRALTAACAALLHDVGHGPFSHTFEAVEKGRGIRKPHEAWTAELVRGDTEIRAELEKFAPGSGLVEEVATLLSQREPRDIYAAIVSSQFDADRLDYLQRDRYMTGTESGGIDFEWLLDCLEVGPITIRVGEETDFVEVDGLYLNHKGLRAAEEYLLARYHLYSQVYMHKTTRAAETMLGALLARVAAWKSDGRVSETGLDENHPLIRYFADSSSARQYLALDDTVIWSALAQMAQARDRTIADFASRLLERRLYKCLDIGVLAQGVGGDSLQRFRKSLNESMPGLGLEKGATLLIDEAKISAYGAYSFDEPGALQKVLIGEGSGDKKEDIAVRSPIVKAIPEQRLYRLYVPDAAALDRLGALWREVVA